MTIATIDANEDHSQYIGEVYEEYYGQLRQYFMKQIGNTTEVDNCVQETIRLLFIFMQDRSWEVEVEFIYVYLMRIAGLLCSRKLAENMSQRRDSFDNNESNNALNKIRTEARQALKECIQFKQFCLKPK